MQFRRTNHIFITALLFLFAAGCGSSVKRDRVSNALSAVKPLPQDTSLLYLDSTAIGNFAKQHPEARKQLQKLESFYEKRNYNFAWINKRGVTEQSGNFINLINHEGSKATVDVSYYKDRLHTLLSKLSEENLKTLLTDTTKNELELLLTFNFFEYADRNWKGMPEEYSRKVEWFIQRKKVNYAEVLDSLLKSNSSAIATYEPVYRQYGLLKKYLQKYYDIEKSGEWSDDWTKRIRKLRKWDINSSIVAIKKQLFLTNDLLKPDSSNVFDNSLEVAVRKFQKRHGLKEDGVIAANTLKAMSISVHYRIRQILINMERCRWVPYDLKGDYLNINIPAFRLLVFHNDSLAWNCKVVVGKTSTSTAIFNDSLEYIVFSPYWNIPQSILNNETFPAIEQDANYLSKHDMEVTDGRGNIIKPSSINWNKYDGYDFPYMIRQKPGKNNSLGRVKFLFPNSYGIYLHDTPQKSLFGETKRAFSHGCIRVEEPMKLAQYLLRDESSWTADSISKVMYGEKETYVKMKNKIPVFITYFTAWVDREGKLNFRDDIYRHDEKMMKLLFN